jgi:mannose-1-phosphate guanylyltransferase
MAGGVGSRFWPLSRANKPKQFLDILGIGKSLLRQTYERFSKIFAPDHIFIVGNAEYGNLITEQIPEIPMRNILLEPFRRNTAPCLAYSIYRLRTIDPEAVMVVAPSDHLILKEEEFRKVVKESLNFVSTHNALLTLGIEPSRPETGYGYIQSDRSKHITIQKTVFKKVKTFTEKPDLELAKIFLKSGDFSWNSGIFFWSLEAITEAMEKYLPDITMAFQEGIGLYGTPKETAFIEETYSGCKNISIDYGIMEKASSIRCVEASFTWSDIGGWNSLREYLPADSANNAHRGNLLTLNAGGNLVWCDNPGDTVMTIGVNDLVIVRVGDKTLVASRDRLEDIKKLVK